MRRCEEFKAKPRLSGIPFLAPWANRLDEQAFYANGKKYPFDMELGNVRGARPIHGLSAFAPQWKVIETARTSDAAWVTSRLEFCARAGLDGAVPVRTYDRDDISAARTACSRSSTTIDNLSSRADAGLRSASIPYFQLADAPRDEWTVAVGARTRVAAVAGQDADGRDAADRAVLPQSARRYGSEISISITCSAISCAIRAGRAVMSVKGKSQRIDVTFGPNYRAAVDLRAERAKEFICFEPMAGITDAMNLAHRGVYKELQTLAPGQTWRESFWIRPSGF